jgi:hypothetical protein
VRGGKVLKIFDIFIPMSSLRRQIYPDSRSFVFQGNLRSLAFQGSFASVIPLNCNQTAAHAAILNARLSVPS